MPAVPVPVPADAVDPQFEFANLAPRQPAIDLADSAIAPNVLSGAPSLERRIEPGIIPTYYNFNGPAPGTVAGIVLGSVAGFILIVWLLYTLTQGGGGGAHIQGEEEIVVRKRRASHSGGRSRRSTRTEVRQYSRSPQRRSQVIVEERRGPRPRSIVVESRVPGDDVVEVIEEHDEYRARRGSRRNSGYR
ncbi:hypothetical protein BDV95DRAFT_556593 [Massariosphaeria phaeospora]|uniref:Uncharacterized protein n=1 Tax=Massariosphaeria phaeospora TaxID=100035 RepID=A0A7C8IMM4_9PLEO|nr:hypothetical protein BDV95DRAFT_556593 [Massariosphaeria phaeospora]